MPGLFDGYLNELTATGSDDSDGLFGEQSSGFKKATPNSLGTRATNKATPLLRYLLVDEFQDFSEAFFR